jgi:hypothetical protein
MFNLQNIAPVFNFSVNGIKTPPKQTKANTACFKPLTSDSGEGFVFFAVPQDNHVGDGW